MAIKKTTKPKNKGGAPKKPLDYPKLSKLCGIHCTGEECASILDVSYEHLNNTLLAEGHGGFLEYFKKNSATGKASLRRKQFTKAVDEGNVPMLIWLGKQYLDQHDKAEVNNRSSDGSMSPKGATLDDFYGDSNV